MNAIAAVQPLKPLRCAVYARVSVEDTSASDFTSIDAQVDSCRAYITSHKAEGWVAIEPCYVDQGYSGGTIDRPALKALLQEMRKGKIDVVLVHRLDRLSRSVADLCDLLPLFTIPGIQLVAVTQSINTSTPAGRLTLNLLTSFAQFERELAGDRTREKLAATRSAGKWQVVPLHLDMASITTKKLSSSSPKRIRCGTFSDALSPWAPRPKFWST